MDKSNMYIPKTEEFTDDMLKEIADEIKSDVSLERRFDDLAMELFSKAFKSGAMSEEEFRQAMRRVL